MTEGKILVRLLLVISMGALCAPWTVNNEAMFPYKEAEEQNQPQMVEQKTNSISSDAQPPEFDDEAEAVIYNGGKYLDGLRLALRDYLRYLDECTSLAKNPRADAAALRRCEQWTRHGQQAQRIAELSLWISKLSQYETQDGLQENALVGRLSQLLQRLALLTGYDPDPAHFYRSIASAAPTEDTTAKSLESEPASAQSDEGERRIKRQVPATGTTDVLNFPQQNSSSNSTPPTTTTTAAFNVVYREHEKTKIRTPAPIPEDPMKDISFYLKSKPGRTSRQDPLQVAQVLGDILRINNNPNIENTRRYGSNYNGLNVFNQSIVKILSDA